jgi:hypothetical protein
VGLRKILAVLRGEEPNPISHEEMLLTVQVSAAIEQRLQQQASIDPRSL